MYGFSASMELRIDWSEVDSFGHVNNLAIMKYAQTARMTCLDSLGIMSHFSETRKGPILASTSCQFKKQLYYPGKVVVCSLVEHIKNTSFQILHIIFDESQERVAEARDVIVMFDFNKNVKMAIPEPFRAALERWTMPMDGVGTV